MLKYIVIFFFLVLITSGNTSNKEKIIENFKNTRNLDFNFEQNVNGKIENGNCTIEYPKKIFCEYAKSNNKILVSNGKSLVIKTITSYYRYPLDKTPLNLILDKEFLINKINVLEERMVDESLINYTIKENDIEINVFFNKETYDLIGWQNTDMYQNFNITFLSSIRKNRIITKNIFKLPTQD
jgi:outer membrane lipoprotein-sorting protein|tara:strand:+ start:93 stop:641 length:549 start_codon:yes stop_codon:yes gene_type:complete